LADFHVAFHSFCKEKISTNFLYPKCCHEFNLLNKELDSHEEYVAIENTSHNDQEIGDLQDDNHSIDAFDSVPNVSTILGCHEVQIVPF